MSKTSTPTTGRICDSCGEFALSARQWGGCSTVYCLPCWRRALEHGHANGLHTDGDSDRDDDGVLLPVHNCPVCERRDPRIDVAEALVAARYELSERLIDVADCEAFGGNTVDYQAEADRVSARIARLVARLKGAL
jgi:hypothetical protein